jgi:2-polyprenyl-6-methoxyphenol hydroxylase-like FAD-dependent oxidoreductase
MATTGRRELRKRAAVPSTGRRGQAGDHAVVLGASLAGLLAARVLTETYRKVTVIDRDELPEIGGHRRGVPHGHHLHALHLRGGEVLEELFPGFTARAVQDGAQLGDALGQCRWLLSGQRFRQAESGLPILFASRPFLEGQVRTRVRALPDVRFLEGTDITDLTTSADRRRVTGVRVHSRDAEPTAVPADLVVDATGRGSRMPVWLEALGYQRPAQERVEIGLGYASRTYRLRPGAVGDDRLIITGGTPDNPRVGWLAVLEGGRHIVTLGGILGDHPPTDPAGFHAFAASLVFADITDAIAGAEPLDDPVPFRFPANVRHRYERLRRFPAGLLVIGDAVSSFNPIYGQGMTVAATEALVLRGLLARHTDLAPGRYFRAITQAVDTPWDIAVGADLAYPDVPGRRTRRIRMVNAYLPRLHAAAGFDVALGTAFVRVMGLLDQPAGLLRPDRALRVWRTNRQHRPRGRATPSHPAG